MNTKRIITRFCLATALTASAPAVFAQDIHFTQFDMAPMVVNPAFTGMFDGLARYISRRGSFRHGIIQGEDESILLF